MCPFTPPPWVVVLAAFCAGGHGDDQEPASQPAPATRPAPKTTALYVAHIGEEDKPIAPLVVAVTKPAAAELSEYLEEITVEMAAHVAVADEPLGRLLAEANRRLAERKDEALTPDFGTFRITIAETEDRAGRVLPKGITRFSRELNKDDAVALFDALLAIDRTEVSPCQAFKDRVTTIKRRLGVKEEK